MMEDRRRQNTACTRCHDRIFCSAPDLLLLHTGAGNRCVTVTVQDGHSVELKETYSNVESKTSTVSFTDTRSSSQSKGASVGYAGVGATKSDTNISSQSRSRSAATMSRVEFSLAMSQAQEHTETRTETLPLQFQVPPMTKYEILVAQSGNAMSQGFNGKVLVEARVTIPPSKREGAADAFSSDGSAYLSEILTESERTFDIEGTLITNEVASSDITFVERKVMDECPK